jgi:hypothetical protein
LQARYTFGPGVDQPLMMERSGETYFYHADRAGSIAAVADSSGNTVCSYPYDSFGHTQPCTGLTNPFGFAGREYERWKNTWPVFAENQSLIGPP